MTLIGRLWLIALAAVALVNAAAANEPLRAQLTPDTEAATSEAPLQPAILAIENTTGQTIEGVALRPDRGGPRFVFPLVAAPGASSRTTVYLPALAGEQTWQVRLLDGDGHTVAGTTAAVRWPIDRVDPGALVAPGLYGRFGYDLPRWSDRLRTNLLATGGIATLAMAALAWMHRSRAKWIGLVVVVLAATGVAAWLTAGEPVVLERTLPVQMGPDANTTDRVLVLTARRTREHTVESGRYVPLYRSPEHMLADETTVRAAGGFTTRLSPDRPMILLIRRGRR
jgi:hypothetical protein